VTDEVDDGEILLAFARNVVERSGTIAVRNIQTLTSSLHHVTPPFSGPEDSRAPQSTSPGRSSQ
jgi:hypothetical protein